VTITEIVSLFYKTGSQLLDRMCQFQHTTRQHYIINKP